MMWDQLCDVLTDPEFLSAKVRCKGGLAELLEDYSAALGSLPKRHAKRPTIESIEQNVLRHLISFEALIEDRTKDFVGGGATFHLIDQFMRDNPSGYCVIYGPPGVGKTALMAQLVKQRDYVHHFNIAMQGISTPKQFIANVCAQLILRYGLPHDRLPDDAHENGLFLSRLLQEASDRRQRDEPAVLVIDALDEAERPGGANPLFLPPALPDGVYVVVTTRPDEEYWLAAMQVRYLALVGRSEENCRDVRDYIEGYLPRAGIQAWMSAHSLEPRQFAELLLEKSQGNFMYLHQVLQAIEAGELQEFSVDDLPNGLRAYYRHHWEKMQRRGRDLFDQVYQPVVCVLGAVGEAVSAGQIAEWTGLEIQQVQQAIKSWREFLIEDRCENGERVYRIYHTSFRDYLHEEVDLRWRPA